MKARGEPLRADDNPEVLRRRLAGLPRSDRAAGHLLPATERAADGRRHGARSRRWRAPSIRRCARRRPRAPARGSRRLRRRPSQAPTSKAKASKARANGPENGHGQSRSKARPGRQTKAANKAVTKPPSRTAPRGRRQAATAGNRKRVRRQACPAQKQSLAEVDETPLNPLISRASSRRCSQRCRAPGSGEACRVIVCGRFSTGINVSAGRSQCGRQQGVNAVARIAGVNIPTNKRVVIALQYIHGIGPKKARKSWRKWRFPMRAGCPS